MGPNFVPIFKVPKGNTAAGSLSTTLSEPLESQLHSKHLEPWGPGGSGLAGRITYVNLWEWLGSLWIGN